MDADSGVITADAVQTVIAELVAQAPSSEVKECLKAYEYGKSERQLKSAFNNNFNKSVLVNTLTYLNVPNQHEYVKSANVDNVICRIQNLLPDTCGLCSKTYCVKNSDPALLSCVFCGQEVHHECLQKLITSNRLSIEETAPKLEELNKNDVAAMINPFGLSGLTYICKACTVSHVPSSDLGLKKKGSKSCNKHTDKEQPLTTDTQNPPSTPPLNESLSQLKTTTSAEDPKSNEPVDELLALHRVVATEETKRDETPVCKFFLYKKCKHGMKGNKCKYSHPPLCKKLMKYGRSEKGCSKGKLCKEGFHPKMCRHSLNSGVCPFENCRFYHVSGTNKVLMIKKDLDKKVPCSQHQAETSVQPNFLDVQTSALQSLKAEILEAMDFRVGTILSQMHMNMNNSQQNQYMNHHYPAPLGYHQAPQKMTSAPSQDHNQIPLRQGYPNQLMPELNSGPQEAMKSNPLNFQGINVPPGYQQMATSQIVA